MSDPKAAPVSERLEALLAEAGGILAEAAKRRASLDKAHSLVTSQLVDAEAAITLLTEAVQIVRASHIQPSESSAGRTTQPYEGYCLAVTRLDGVDVWMHTYDRPDAPEKPIVFSIWPLEFLKSDDEYRFPSFVYAKVHSRFWANVVNGVPQEREIITALQSHGLLAKRYAKDKQDVKDEVFGMVEVHYPWGNQDGIGCLEKIVVTHTAYGIEGVNGVLNLASSDHGTLVNLTGDDWKKYEQRWANQRRTETFAKAMKDNPQGLSIPDLDKWIDAIVTESRARSYLTLGMNDFHQRADQRLVLLKQFRLVREEQEKLGIAPF